MVRDKHMGSSVVWCVVWFGGGVVGPMCICHSSHISMD